AERLAGNLGRTLDTEVYLVADGTALVIAGYLTDHRHGDFAVDLMIAPALLDLALARHQARPYVLGRWQSPFFSRAHAPARPGRRARPGAPVTQPPAPPPPHPRAQSTASTAASATACARSSPTRRSACPRCSPTWRRPRTAGCPCPPRAACSSTSACAAAT